MDEAMNDTPRCFGELLPRASKGGQPRTCEFVEPPTPGLQFSNHIGGWHFEYGDARAGQLRNPRLPGGIAYTCSGLPDWGPIRQRREENPPDISHPLAKTRS